MRDNISLHNESRKKCEDLMKQSQGIQHMFMSKTYMDKKEYRTLLITAVDCIQFLLRQELSFRGRDENESSLNQGTYLGLFHFLAEHSEEVKHVSFSNVLASLQMTSSKVQKDICRAAALETLNAIMKDIGDSYFSVLVDKSLDVSIKEHMVVALRYVDKNGHVIECFVGLKHVTSTTAISLKSGLDDLLAQHKLSISRIRSQGYDGASNMQEEFNGLKSLILSDNAYAFYVYCLAHQLQLPLVVVAKKRFQVKTLFEFVSMIINTVEASCKKSDSLKALQQDNILKKLKDGNLFSGRGLNQETSL